MNFKDIIELIKDRLNGKGYSIGMNMFEVEPFYCDDKSDWFYRTEQVSVVGIETKENEQILQELLNNKKFHFNGIFKKSLHKVYRFGHISTGFKFQYDIIEEKKYNFYEIVLDNKYIMYFQYFTKDTSKNFEGIKTFDKVKSGGVDSMMEINRLGREKGLWSTTMFQYFCDRNVDKTYKHMLKLCVPNQIGYIWGRTQKVIDKCFKADVSSAFPSQLTKRVPILRDVKILVNQEASATDKYPFVFTYKKGMKYGRVQILETDGTYIDTDIDLQDKFMQKVRLQLLTGETRNAYLKGEYVEKGKHYNITLPEEDIVTICCPASKISLKTIMEELYQVKLNGTTHEEIQKAKDTMNAFIGYLQMNTNPAMAFISAVVIARQNHSMLDKCHKLEEEGNFICYIATDCIVWKGYDSDVSVNEKYLGSFTKEYSNCRFYGITVGAYQIEAEGKTTTYATYIENTDEKKQIKFGELPLPKDGRYLI